MELNIMFIAILIAMRCSIFPLSPACSTSTEETIASAVRFSQTQPRYVINAPN